MCLKKCIWWKRELPYGITALKQFFLSSQKIDSIRHVTFISIKFIVSYLSLKGYIHSNLSAYLAAISFQCKLYCHVDPTKHFMVHKLLQDMKRSNKNTATRLPITIDILNSVIPKLQLVCSHLYEEKYFRAAFSIAFHALLWVGEITL